MNSVNRVNRERHPARVSVRAGVISFESKPMPLKRAQSFCAMLTANRRRPVAGSQIEKAGKAGFVVCWVPAAEARQAALFDRYEEEQIRRMESEYSTWRWEELPGDPDQAAIVTTLELDEKTGEIKRENHYRVSAKACACPQYENRCRPVGAHCKHQWGLSRHRAEEAAALRAQHAREQRCIEIHATGRRPL